ncbi:acetyltransferase [Enterococcus saigonensis]|uniref:Acetyltransferase n=1 Tax=Enterococcus saigonensis TaxID=1805431 RepID=A0A679IRX2_9ENTE|nr:GNAT family N-acetyltransferase [Enterococcus saigonensis]BCA86137.1 acetyltransferase [Enterococcus saigonensis]
MKIETKRLILRPWQKGEAFALSQFLQDERVMYAYEGAFSDEEVIAWLNWNLKLYQEKGYGLFAMVCKKDGKIIGECGLTNQVVNGKTYLEIGYHLVYDAWKKGYATEAAQAVKEYAFNTLGATTVVSIVRDTNIASMNVAIRNQMVVKERFIKNYRNVMMPHYLFIATK